MKIVCKAIPMYTRAITQILYYITYCIIMYYYNMHMNSTYPVLITTESEVIILLKHKNTLTYSCKCNLNKSDTHTVLLILIWGQCSNHQYKFCLNLEIVTESFIIQNYFIFYTKKFIIKNVTHITATDIKKIRLTF
jgi:hypothetical protein